MIFISHRETDKEVADMLVDFFASTGIPKDKVFCSSLPGNKVHKKISEEVKEALKNSIIDIVILSSNYYQSAYCLNEAGIIWYKDKNIIPIALPEIDESNMYGFLNNDYKLHRLDSETDISDIYDTVREPLKVSPVVRTSTIISESHKLINRYKEFTQKREETISVNNNSQNYFVSDMTTDDERIVLYYILQKNVCKVNKSEITDWLQENEIYGVNIDNAFELLSSFGDGKVENNTLKVDIDVFRSFSSNKDVITSELKKYVDNHIKLSVDRFNRLWEDGTMSNMEKLFIAYIVEEQVYNFWCNWRKGEQIENIKNWETKNSLHSTLSDNYIECLKYFIKNNLVYESEWSNYGKPRMYSLCISLKKFLFKCPKEYIDVLKNAKKHYYNLIW